jgi:hypothetical protein
MMNKQFSCTVRKLMFPFALACGLALCAASAQADVYKWVDSNNEVQYTQTPPPAGVEFTRIGSAAAPAHDPAEADTSLQERLEASEEQKQQKAKATSDAEQQAEIARISRQNCVNARKNLEQLGRSGQIRYKTGEGEELRLSEEERQQRIEEAQGQVKEFCKD